MRTVTLLTWIAVGVGSGCGSETPMLGGVPHPNNAAMAGGAAAAAAALTLADPHAADRKPEQPQVEDKRPVEVHEEVPASAFDHLDSQTGAGSGSGSAHELARPHMKPIVKPAAPATGSGSGSAARAGKKPPVIPSARDAVDPDHR